MRPSTRGHKHKLCKKNFASRVMATFFSECVINVWNSLPSNVDFGSLVIFKCSIETVDFTKFLRCFS